MSRSPFFLANLALFALACALGLPLAAHADALDEQLAVIRELGRFRPDTALLELDKIAPQMPAASRLQRTNFTVEQIYDDLRLGKREQALVLANGLLAESKRGSDPVLLTKAMLARGSVASDMSEPAAAHALIFAAAALAEHTQDRRLQIQTRLATSGAQIDQGDFAAALANLQSALSSARTLNESGLLSSVLDALAALYDRTKQFDKGFAANAETYAIGLAMNSPGRAATAKLTEYALAIDADQPERGRRALLDALAMGKKINAAEILTGVLVNLSDSYLKAGDLISTANYARQAMTAARVHNDESNEATAEFNLGIAYLGQGKIALGVSNCEAGLRYYEKADSKPELQDVLVEYGAALERAGRFQAAVTAYHRERALMDALFQMRQQKAVLEIQQKYEAKIQQRQIESLLRDNRLKSIELANRGLQQRLWLMLSALVAMALAILILTMRRVRGRNRQLESSNSALKKDNARDPLTGLYNRRHFQESVRDYEPGTARAANTVQESVGALFVLDLDHFKRINDRYGHAAGDAVLKSISLRLQEILRETDMIFRWGGEEFLAFLPKLPHQEMEEVARRILRGIAGTTIEFQTHTLSSRISIGFAPFPLRHGPEILSLDRVIHLVDMALYVAKNQGRNRACGLIAILDASAAGLDAAERDLGEAWREGVVDLQFVVEEENQSVPA